MGAGTSAQQVAEKTNEEQLEEQQEQGQLAEGLEDESVDVKALHKNGNYALTNGTAEEEIESGIQAEFINGHQEETEIKKVGQQEPSNVILNEGSCENVEVVTDDKTSKDNVGEVGDEGPEAAVLEPVSGDKDDLPEQVTEDQSNEVGFKKVFKFVGFKFTVKKEKTEKSEPVQLLTVKKDEVEANGTENTVKQVDNEQKQETEEESKEISETANEVAKCVETVVETEKEEVGEKPTEKESEVEKEQKKSPESPTNPIVTETSSPFKKFFTQGWAGLRKKTSFRKSKEEDHQEVEKSIQEQQNETQEDASKKEVDLEEAPEVGLELQEEKTVETEEAKAPVDTVETIVVEASKAEEHSSDAIQIISEEDIEKVDCVKSVTEKVDDVKEIATEIASVELKELDKIKPEADVPEENIVNQINEVMPYCSSPLIEPNETPSVFSSDTEIKITNLVVEDLAQQLSTSSEGTEIEKVQETITTEADLLSSQEKAKLQGSPLRKLFSGSGLRKLSGKKQKGKKDEDTKPEDVTEQAPVSSEPEISESNEVDSSPSSPDESVEVSPTEKLTEDVPQASEAEGEGATSEGERKKEGITPWASFKKMVTPKKRAKVPSESDKEDDVEKVKSSTMSSTDSAASVENQVETKEGVEEQKLEKSAEENRKKVDSSVSWEALICVGGSKKRGRKTSDSDEEDVHKSLEESKKNEDEADKAKENYSEEPISQEKENLDDSPSPDQGNSPNEVDGVSTWQSFKRLVTPRRKSKTRIEDKADEPAGVSSVEQSTSEGEAGKDESWVSLKKLIPGRKKKKSDGKLEQAPSNDAGEVAQKSEVADEDSDVPAVVPLSEFDAAEQEKIDAQKSVEIFTNNYLTEPEIAPEISSEELIHAVTVTVIEGERAVTSLDERSPSWISATVTEQTKELQTKERIESEVIVEEALILSTVSQVIVEAKNLTREAELTSEALTALEEAIEISGAEETTEMISAVSQLTESSATTEEGTPVPEEDGIHSVEEQQKHIKHILYAATESAKLSVDAIVDNVTYAIVNLSQNQESEVEYTDDSKTSLQKSAFDFEKVENIEVKDKPDQLPESAIVETEVDSSEKDILDFEIISTSECMPSVQEEIHKDENVENVKQIVDASAEQAITILAVESADVEKTEKTSAIILTKEQMEDTVITKENIEKETIPLSSEEHKEKMEVADEGNALEFVSVLIKNHIVEESGLVYVEEQVIEESSPLLAKEQTKEERPLILADEEVKSFPFSEEHTKEKSIPLLSEEKAKEETTCVLAVEQVQEESAPTVEASSKEESEPVLAEETKEKISHAVSEGEDKDVSVTALTVPYYKEENAYASTMVEMENERFKALPQEQLECFSVLEEDKSIDEKALLQADESIPLAQAEDERVSDLEEDLSKDGAPCLAKEQMEETISVAQEKQTEDKSVPALVQEQVKEENTSVLKEDLAKGDSSSPLAEEQVDENIPVMQEEQTKDESVPSLIQEQIEGVSFLKEGLTKDNASLLTNEQVEENIFLVQGEQAKEETVPALAKEQVEERVSALEEQVEETTTETQEELAEDESASSLVREQIGESIPVAQAEQTKEKSVLSLTKELEEEIVSVLEKQVEESITVAKKELVEGASSLAKEQIESIPVVEEQVKEESIPYLAKVQLDYKNVSLLEQQIEESITVTLEEQAYGESASTLAKEQIEEGIATVEEHIKVESVPALAKVQLEDEIVSVLEEQIEESITVAQEELTDGESASTLAKEQIEEGIAAVEEHIKVESVPALAEVQLEVEIVSVVKEQVEESITVAQEELTDGESALSLTKEVEESIPDIQANDESLPAFVNDQVVEESIPLFQEEQAKDENSSSLTEQVEEESIPGVEKQTKDKSDPALAKEHLEEESIPLVQEEQSKYESVPSLAEQVEKESIPEADVQQAKDGVPSLTKEQEEGVAEIGEDLNKDKIATCLNNEGVEESGVAPNEQAKDESAQDLAEKQAAEGSDLIVQQTISAAIFMEKNAEDVTVENEKPDTEVSPEKIPKESAYAEDVAQLSSVKNHEGAPSSAAEVLYVLDTEIQESVLESSRVLIEESCPEDASEIPTEVHDAGDLLPKELKDQEKESSLVDQSLGECAYIQDSVSIISNDITPSETHECVTESSKEIEEPEIIRDVTVEHSTSFHLSLVKDLTETCNDGVNTENIAEIKSAEAKGASEPVTAAAVEESILEETTKPIVSQTESLIRTGDDLANSEGLKVTSEYVKSGVKAVSQTAASIVDAAIDAATSCVAMSTIPKETEESWVDKNEVVTLENMETEREEHNSSQTDLESHSTKIVQKIIKTSLESLSQSLPVELVSEIHEIASAPEVSTKESITVEVTQVFQQTLLEQVILEHSSILEIEQITKEPCCEPIEIVSTSKLTNGNAEELAQGEHISNVCVTLEEVMPKEISHCVNVDEQVKLNVQILEAESETTLVTRSEEKTTVKDSSEEHTPKTTNTVES